MVYIIEIIIFLLVSFFVALKINAFHRKEATFASQIAKLEKEFTKNNYQKKLLLSAWDSFNQAVLILNENDTIEYLNNQAEKLLGIVAKKSLGKKITEIKDNPVWSALKALLLQEHRYSFKKELYIHEHCMLSIETLRLVFGKNYSGRLVLINDITKSKIIERTKMDFVALTAHQLNVPLSTTRLSLGMLLDGSLGKITKEQREVIDKTLQRNNMLIGLVADLLDISKIQERHHAYQWDLVDVSLLIKSVVDADYQELKNKKIHFTLEKPQDMPTHLLIDKDKMFVAMKNLLDNAIKYTQKQGAITIKYGVEKKQFYFSVIDSGIGVPIAEKGKLFSRFFRAPNAVAFETSGSGLGLFIVKNIIEAHHGKIWFDSSERQGSAFHFSIPVREVE